MNIFEKCIPIEFALHVFAERPIHNADRFNNAHFNELVNKHFQHLLVLAPTIKNCSQNR
jgi:hypothetical protein